MNARFIDWIWHIRGSVALAPGQSGEDAFERLEPLFRQTGTNHECASDTLTFQKKDQAAQDKMSVFDSGVLQIERGETGQLLRYHLISRILLFCFLAPLLFLAVAQLTIVVNTFQKSTSAAKEKAAEEAENKLADVPMNPIDKALGAPAPKKPSKKDRDELGKRDKKPTPTPAYVFAGIFAFLYLAGRILEDRLVKSLFTKRLSVDRAFEGLALSGKQTFLQS